MPISVTFHGAAGAVTGSCFRLETSRARILVDCGLFQGSKTEKELNYRDFPFEPARIDALVLTHAHIDHSGLVPKLVKAGFSGRVHATEETADLASIMLPDSGAIQESEVARLNRRNAQRGRPAVTPIYTADDAARALAQFTAQDYGDLVEIAPGIHLRFWNAGHLLGSASAEILVEDGDERLALLFSGDIGPDDKLLQADPDGPRGLDYVVCESTYGDTSRPPLDPARRRARLVDEVREAVRPAGVLLIPSFAVERTQELLVDLVAAMDEGAIPRAPIFIDSPLATRASAVFGRHAQSMPEGAALVRALGAPMVRFTPGVEESKAIARIGSFHIVLAGSGMCDAGRIRHHLKARLWRDDTTVLLPGFQAQGTLGRILADGATRVRIMGEEVRVRARIRTLDVYSGHADADGLAAWLAARAPIREGLFLVHGEEAALAALAQRARTLLPGTPVHVPALDEDFVLTLEGAVSRQEAPAPRLPRERLGRLDWHNDLARLTLDISAAMEARADERSRAALVRRLRRALEEDGG
ncbi:MBL fold metallo-hydrolase RNA specificity domain-containing protein [Salinarimonas chemoclinalis]|uniref:MBL fold metallo-hydrolase RNA specificity domain-containing protein n=1 Tax=Salinarimonas chemoclinalis TaxID=3241599 RepID=UPI003556F018